MFRLFDADNVLNSIWDGSEGGKQFFQIFIRIRNMLNIS